MATDTRRVVIIGAGHNGLVTAFYLAKAGYKPLRLERRQIVGGVAVTEEICPGFRCSTIAHAPGPLLPQVINDLELKQHGLEIIRTDERVVALHPDGRALLIYEDARRTANELAAFSEHDAKRYPEFHSCLGRLGAALRPLILRTPPDIEHLKMNDYLGLGRLG